MVYITESILESLMYKDLIQKNPGRAIAGSYCVSFGKEKSNYFFFFFFFDRGLMLTYSLVCITFEKD